MGLFDDVDYSGMEYHVHTFKSALTPAAIGKMAKVTADGTVELAGNDDEFIGPIKQIDAADKAASVITAGIVTMTYSGTAPSHNTALFLSDASGDVKTDASGIRCRVFKVDTTNKLVTFMLW
ncbi:hypothetical protein ES703_09169 [subsurface metagenome]